MHEDSSILGTNEMFGETSISTKIQELNGKETYIVWVVATQIFFIFTPKIGEDEHMNPI